MAKMVGEFVELKGRSGVLYIRKDDISRVVDGEGGGCHVRLKNDGSEFVKESAADVLKAIGEVS